MGIRYGTLYRIVGDGERPRWPHTAHGTGRSAEEDHDHHFLISKRNLQDSLLYDTRHTCHARLRHGLRWPPDERGQTTTAAPAARDSRPRPQAQRAFPTPQSDLPLAFPPLGRPPCPRRGQARLCRNSQPSTARSCLSSGRRSRRGSPAPLTSALPAWHGAPHVSEQSVCACGSTSCRQGLPPLRRRASGSSA